MRPSDVSPPDTPALALPHSSSTARAEATGPYARAASDCDASSDASEPALSGVAPPTNAGGPPRPGGGRAAARFAAPVPALSDEDRCSRRRRASLAWCSDEDGAPGVAGEGMGDSSGAVATLTGTAEGRDDELLAAAAA